MNNDQDVHQNTTRNGYRTAFNRLLLEGDTSIYYLNGSGKLGGPIATDFQAQAGPIAGTHVSNYAFSAFAHYIGVSPGLVETLADIKPTLRTAIQYFACQDKVERILNHIEPAESVQAILEIHNNTIPPHGKTFANLEAPVLRPRQSGRENQITTDKCAAMWYDDTTMEQESRGKSRNGEKRLILA